MDTNSLSNLEKSQNSTKTSLFSFLTKENLTKEEFESNMKSLIFLELDEKENLAQLNSIKEEVVLLMIDSAVKFNDGILFIKFLINLSKAKKNSNLNNILNNTHISDLFLIYFKTLCLFVKSNETKEKLSLDKIIKDYEDILMIT